LYRVKLDNYSVSLMGARQISVAHNFACRCHSDHLRWREITWVL